MNIFLLDADNDTTLIYLAAAALSFFIFYQLAKAAVRNGIIEAWEKREQANKSKPPSKLEEPQWDVDQRILQARYDRGEITLEEYKKEWEKIK